MKNRNEIMKLSALALAMSAALCAIPAYADDEEAEALKKPTNFVEIGAANTSTSSARFGEYSGLNKSGVTVVGNLGIRGGDAYDNNGGTTRWSLFGNDLGLTSRSLGGAISNQGKWSLGISYDELKHNLSDTYQTPYVGSVGGNSFTLPAAFGITSNSTALNAAQLASFRTVDVESTRRNTTLAAGIWLTPQWDIKLDYNHLEQSGAKLMGFGSMKTGATTNEFVSILPNPTNYQTDTASLAVNWIGDKGHLTASYMTVFFRDGFDRVTFQTWAGANTTQIMSTPPSSNFNQLNLSGGWNFSPRTRLTGNASYGRNTQNDAFVFDAYMMVKPSPAASLNGVVVTKHGDLKLTDQSFRDLMLSAGVKYDERDNRTASNIYNFYAISGANIANYPNTPLSFKKDQFEVAADYRFKRDHHFRLAFDHDDVSRWCGQYAVNAGYPAGTNCVVATGHTEDKVDASYRLKANESMDFKLGYVYSKRKTDSDPNAIAAFISTNGGLAGQNAGDFRGFYPFFDASRTQQAAKANANWQVDDKLSFSVGGRYTEDAYDSTYGVQKGNSWSLNLDATYNFSEYGSISSYVTQQYRQRDMTNQQNAALVTATAARINVPANSNWSNQLKDDSFTVGLGVKQGGLIGGKLDLSGDLTYSIGKTGYATQLNYAGLTTGGLSCSDPSILSCGQLPDIKSTTTQLKLTGIYQVQKNAKVALRYVYQRLSGLDYYYNGYAYGGTPTSLMPTNQQLGNYSVNVISLSYIYNF